MAKHILVVDDEEVVREIITSILVRAGYECSVAENGVGALALLAQQKFDLLLTDLMMFEMDGLALMERSQVAYPNMPMVVESSIHDIRIVIQSFQTGARDYLLVPFEREELLAVVRRALETPLLNPEKPYAIRHELFDKLTIKLTDGPSRRVAAYSIALARRMGLPKEEILIISRGAFLRDIGKTDIAHAIPGKAGQLTPAEVAVIQRHCYAGYQIIRAVEFLAETADIVYCHHEHYDGSGYPRGLKGSEIPLGARILAVAEAWESISSNSQRTSQSSDAMKEELRRCSGTQFDPAVVAALLSIPDELWGHLQM
jgi:response regulator RpfG family c-di-GMP phosphodiesterase